MTQYFDETDALEARQASIIIEVLESIERDLTEFFNEAYQTASLGDVLYLLDRDPMAGKLLNEYYRTAYPAIHEMFTRPATFDFYVDLIRAVWGEDTPIEFSRPSPGVLDIKVSSQSLQPQVFQARRIEDDTYIYEDVVTSGDDPEEILFQTAQGIKTQAEADLLISEVAAAGYVTNIELEVD